MPTYRKGTRQWAEQRIKELLADMVTVSRGDFAIGDDPWEYCDHSNFCEGAECLCHEVASAKTDREDLFNSLVIAWEDLDTTFHKLPEGSPTYSQAELEAMGQGTMFAGEIA